MENNIFDRKEGNRKAVFPADHQIMYERNCHGNFHCFLTCLPICLPVCLCVGMQGAEHTLEEQNKQNTHTHTLNTAGQNHTHTHKLLLFWKGQSDCEVGRWMVADRCHTAPGNTPCFVCTLSRLDRIASQKRRWRRTHTYKNHTQTQRS